MNSEKPRQSGTEHKKTDLQETADDCLKTDEDFLITLTARDLHQLKQKLFAAINYSRAMTNMQRVGNLTDSEITEFNQGIYEAAQAANEIILEITERPREETPK